MDFRVPPPHWLQDISIAVPILHQIQEATDRVMPPSRATLPRYFGQDRLISAFQCRLMPRQQVNILYHRTRPTKRSSRSCLQTLQQTHLGAAGHVFVRSTGFWPSVLPPAFARTAQASWTMKVRRYRSLRLLTPNKRIMPTVATNAVAIIGPISSISPICWHI